MIDRTRQRVAVFEYKRPDDSAPGTPYDKVEAGYAWFHQFGQESEDGEFGPIHSCVAIIENDDGKVETICAHMIQFKSD